MDKIGSTDLVGVSVVEAARLVGIGRSRFLEELRAGRGPRVVKLGRRVIVPVDGLRSWLEKQAGAYRPQESRRSAHAAA